MHASSNLRMVVDVDQDSFEPGAKAVLRAELTEYDVPVDGRAEVQALLTDPTGGQVVLPLPEVAPGVFEEAFAAHLPGVWNVLFQASGKTMRGTPFTREDVRTVSVWRGGDSYEPTEGEEPDVKRRRDHSRAWEIVLQDPRLVELLSKRLAAAGLSLQDLELEKV